MDCRQLISRSSPELSAARCSEHCVLLNYALIGANKVFIFSRRDKVCGRERRKRRRRATCRSPSIRRLRAASHLSVLYKTNPTLQLESFLKSSESLYLANLAEEKNERKSLLRKGLCSVLLFNVKNAENPAGLSSSSSSSNTCSRFLSHFFSLLCVLVLKLQVCSSGFLLFSERMLIGWTDGWFQKSPASLTRWMCTILVSVKSHRSDCPVKNRLREE